MFFDDSKQQIEKKMLLLEGIALLKDPAHDILMDLMLRDGRMNYFEFTHCLGELKDSGLVRDAGTNRYRLTERGENAILYFSDRVEEETLNALKTTAETLNTHAPTYTSEWSVYEGAQVLKLMHSERGLCLILSMEDRKLGEAMAKAWTQQNRQALTALMNLLTDALFAPPRE